MAEKLTTRDNSDSFHSLGPRQRTATPPALSIPAPVDTFRASLPTSLPISLPLGTIATSPAGMASSPPTECDANSDAATAFLSKRNSGSEGNACRHQVSVPLSLPCASAPSAAAASSPLFDENTGGTWGNCMAEKNEPVLPRLTRLAPAPIPTRQNSISSPAYDAIDNGAHHRNDDEADAVMGSSRRKDRHSTSEGKMTGAGGTKIAAAEAVLPPITGTQLSISTSPPAAVSSTTVAPFDPHEMHPAFRSLFLPHVGTHLRLDAAACEEAWLWMDQLGHEAQRAVGVALRHRLAGIAIREGDEGTTEARVGGKTTTTTTNVSGRYRGGTHANSSSSKRDGKSNHSTSYFWRLHNSFLYGSSLASLRRSGGGNGGGRIDLRRGGNSSRAARSSRSHLCSRPTHRRGQLQNRLHQFHRRTISPIRNAGRAGCATPWVAVVIRIPPHLASEFHGDAAQPRGGNAGGGGREQEQAHAQQQERGEISVAVDTTPVRRSALPGFAARSRSPSSLEPSDGGNNNTNEDETNSSASAAMLVSSFTHQHHLPYVASAAVGLPTGVGSPVTFTASTTGATCFPLAAASAVSVSTAAAASPHPAEQQEEVGDGTVEFNCLASTPCRVAPLQGRRRPSDLRPGSAGPARSLPQLSAQPQESLSVSAYGGAPATTTTVHAVPADAFYRKHHSLPSNNSNEVGEEASVCYLCLTPPLGCPRASVGGSAALERDLIHHCNHSSRNDSGEPDEEDDMSVESVTVTLRLPKGCCIPALQADLDTAGVLSTVAAALVDPTVDSLKSVLRATGGDGGGNDRCVPRTSLHRSPHVRALRSLVRIFLCQHRIDRPAPRGFALALAAAADGTGNGGHFRRSACSASIIREDASHGGRCERSPRPSAMEWVVAVAAALAVGHPQCAVETALAALHRTAAAAAEVWTPLANQPFTQLFAIARTAIFFETWGESNGMRLPSSSLAHASKGRSASTVTREKCEASVAVLSLPLFLATLIFGHYRSRNNSNGDENDDPCHERWRVIVAQALSHPAYAPLPCATVTVPPTHGNSLAGHIRRLQKQRRQHRSHHPPTAVGVDDNCHAFSSPLNESLCLHRVREGRQAYHGSLVGTLTDITALLADRNHPLVPLVTMGNVSVTGPAFSGVGGGAGFSLTGSGIRPMDSTGEDGWLQGATVSTVETPSGGIVTGAIAHSTTHDAPGSSSIHSRLTFTTTAATSGATSEGSHLHSGATRSSQPLLGPMTSLHVPTIATTAALAGASVCSSSRDGWSIQSDRTPLTHPPLTAIGLPRYPTFESSIGGGVNGSGMATTIGTPAAGAPPPLPTSRAINHFNTSVSDESPFPSLTSRGTGGGPRGGPDVGPPVGLLEVPITTSAAAAAKSSCSGHRRNEHGSGSSGRQEGEANSDTILNFARMMADEDVEAAKGAFDAIATAVASLRAQHQQRVSAMTAFGAAPSDFASRLLRLHTVGTVQKEDVVFTERAVLAMPLWIQSPSPIYAVTNADRDRDNSEDKDLPSHATLFCDRSIPHPREHCHLPSCGEGGPCAVELASSMANANVARAQASQQIDHLFVTTTTTTTVPTMLTPWTELLSPREFVRMPRNRGSSSPLSTSLTVHRRPISSRGDFLMLASADAMPTGVSASAPSPSLHAAHVPPTASTCGGSHYHILPLQLQSWQQHHHHHHQSPPIVAWAASCHECGGRFTRRDLTGVIHCPLHKLYVSDKSSLCDAVYCSHLCQRRAWHYHHYAECPATGTSATDGTERNGKGILSEDAHSEDNDRCNRHACCLEAIRAAVARCVQFEEHLLERATSPQPQPQQQQQPHRNPQGPRRNNNIDTLGALDDFDYVHDVVTPFDTATTTTSTTTSGSVDDGGGVSTHHSMRNPRDTVSTCTQPICGSLLLQPSPFATHIEGPRRLSRPHPRQLPPPRVLLTIIALRLVVRLVLRAVAVVVPGLTRLYACDKLRDGEDSDDERETDEDRNVVTELTLTRRAMVAKLDADSFGKSFRSSNSNKLNKNSQRHYMLLLQAESVLQTLGVPFFADTNLARPQTVGEALRNCPHTAPTGSTASTTPSFRQHEETDLLTDARALTGVAATTVISFLGDAHAALTMEMEGTHSTSWGNGTSREWTAAQLLAFLRDTRFADQLWDLCTTSFAVVKSSGGGDGTFDNAADATAITSTASGAPHPTQMHTHHSGKNEVPVVVLSPFLSTATDLRSFSPENYSATRFFPEHTERDLAKPPSAPPAKTTVAAAAVVKNMSPGASLHSSSSLIPTILSPATASLSLISPGVGLQYAAEQNSNFLSISSVSAVSAITAFADAHQTAAAATCTGTGIGTATVPSKTAFPGEDAVNVVGGDSSCSVGGRPRPSTFAEAFRRADSNITVTLEWRRKKREEVPCTAGHRPSSYSEEDLPRCGNTICGGDCDLVVVARAVSEMPAGDIVYYASHPTGKSVR